MNDDKPKKELTFTNSDVGAELAWFCAVGIVQCTLAILTSTGAIIALVLIFFANPFLWVWSKLVPPENNGSL